MEIIIEEKGKYNLKNEQFKLSADFLNLDDKKCIRMNERHDCVRDFRLALNCLNIVRKRCIKYESG